MLLRSLVAAPRPLLARLGAAGAAVTAAAPPPAAACRSFSSGGRSDDERLAAAVRDAVARREGKPRLSVPAVGRRVPARIEIELPPDEFGGGGESALQRLRRRAGGGSLSSEKPLCWAVPAGSGRAFGPFAEKTLECNAAARRATGRLHGP